MPFVCFGAIGAVAADLGYEVNVGVAHSDNIARTETNTINEEIATGGIMFSLSQVSPRLSADLVGNFAYHDYLDNTYESELFGNFVGSARFQIIPERFSWMLTDNFGEVLSDPFQPATPDNRENINYLMTGPDLTLAFGSQTWARIGARYMLTTYEETPFDSASTAAEIEIGRRMSAATAISLNASVQRHEYDDVTGADYDQGEVFLRYSAEGARTFVTIEAGYSKLEPEGDAESEGGLLLRFDASRRVSASSTLNLTVRREFSDAGSAFSTIQSSSSIGLGAAPGRQLSDPFTHDYVSVGWSFFRNRTGLRLSGSFSEQSYHDRPLLDQKLVSAAASVDRQLTSVTSLSVGTSYLRAEFKEPGGDYDEISAGVGFTWRPSPALSVRLRYDYVDRNSESPPGDDYVENRYWLSIGFGRGAPRSEVMRPTFAVDAVQTGN